MLVAISAFLVLLILLAVTLRLRRPSQADGRASISAAFRALLPSFRFFDRAAPVPRLWCRTQATNADWGSWQPLLTPPPRTALAFVHNPSGNLFLAYAALLERLVDELSELGEGDEARVELLVSYELVVRLVRAELNRQLQRTDRFQFRLTLADDRDHCDDWDGRPGEHAETIVTSRAHDVQ